MCQFCSCKTTSHPTSGAPALKAQITLTRRIDALSTGIGSLAHRTHDAQKAAPWPCGRETALPARGGRLHSWISARRTRENQHT
jgi:hypothetical protein